MIRNKIYLIPNLLTTGSVLCGFVSIIYSFNENLIIAANLLLVAFVLRKKPVLVGTAVKIWESGAKANFGVGMGLGGIFFSYSFVSWVSAG